MLVHQCRLSSERKGGILDFITNLGLYKVLLREKLNVKNNHVHNAFHDVS